MIHWFFYAYIALNLLGFALWTYIASWRRYPSITETTRVQDYAKGIGNLIQVGVGIYMLFHL